MGFVSATNAIMYFAFPLYIYDISASYTLVGLSMSIPFVFFSIFTYIWGHLSDRLGNRRNLLLMTNAAGAITFPILLIGGPMAVIVVKSIQSTFLSSQVLYPVMSTEYAPHKKTWAISRIEVASGLGGSIGSVFGALTLANWFFVSAPGFTLVFILCTVLTLLAAILLFFTPESYSGDTKAVEIPDYSLLTNVKFRPILIFTVMTFLLFSGNYMVLTVFPTYLNHLGFTPSTVGLLVALASLTGTGAAYVSPGLIERIGGRKTYIVAIIAYIIVILGYAITDNKIVVILLWSIPLWNFFYVAVTSLAAIYSSPEERGTAIGILMGGMSLGILVGSSLSGILVDLMGFQRSFLAGASIMVLPLLIALLWNEKPSKIKNSP